MSPEAAKIGPKQLYELYQSGKPVELIDVRTPAEYRSLHATIARLVPLDELNPKRFMETRRWSEGRATLRHLPVGNTGREGV